MRIFSTLPNHVYKRVMEVQRRNNFVVGSDNTGIVWGLSVCLGSWWNETKQIVQGRNCFVLLLSLTAMLRLSRSLRVSATQDTDKPEIQPVSEPESLHCCVLSCVRVGQV